MSAIQPDNYQALLTAKVARAQDQLRPLGPPPPTVTPSAPLGYRMRAEFRVWHDGEALDYIMFDPQDPKSRLTITDFPVVHDSIQTLMKPLLSALRGNSVLRHKLFQVEFLASLSGECLVTLIYHRKLDSVWEDAAATLRAALSSQRGPLSLIGRSRKQKVVLGDDYVTERLTVEDREFQYRQYEQAFTQPNALVNRAMIEWACQQAAVLSGDLLELYCGNGNFTLPLAYHFEQVIATEVAKVSARAARHNITNNRIDNVQIIRLSAQEVSDAMAGTRKFRRLQELPQALHEYQLETVLVDPPRAGLDAATRAMVAAFTNILYISCNPDTLTRDLEQLCDSHTIEAYALFDQFPYTDHLESGVRLRKRNR
ncbi:MAG: tRNA (uridine(54)-C5)-methyltransferase TrmA [Pseudomonadota bacterium]